MMMTHVGMFEEAIKIEKLKKRVDELTKINKEHQKLNGTLRQEAAEEKKRRQFAENELSLIKGIGNNSPEMKILKSEVQALKQQLHLDSEKHKKEMDLVREDNQLLNLENGRMMKKLQKKDS